MLSYVLCVSTPTPINIYTRSPCSMLLINFWTDPSSSSDSSAWSAFLWLLFIIVTMFSIISLFLAANGACWATFKFWVWDFICDTLSTTLMNWTRGFSKQALQIDDLQIWTSTPDESFASNWIKVGFMGSYKEVAIYSMSCHVCFFLLLMIFPTHALTLSSQLYTNLALWLPLPSTLLQTCWLSCNFPPPNEQLDTNCRSLILITILLIAHLSATLLI